jgi:predicted permease
MRLTSTGLWADLLHAGRSLAKARAFTLVCVLSLGIGMAPVITIAFGVRVFTTPPPGLNADGLVEVVTKRVGARGASDKWSYPDFVDLRDAQTGVTMTGWARGAISVTIPATGEKRTLRALFVSPNYFSTMGVSLARGPGYLETADAAVILSHDFWQNRLNSDPAIVGKPLILGGVPHVVAGIVAGPFTGHLSGQEAELFLPLDRDPDALGDGRFDRNKEWVQIHGRLLSGAGLAQASAAVSATTAGLAKAYPATNELRAGVVHAYHPSGSLESDDMPIMVGVLQTMTLAPLLVVCLNISGMVQVRTAMRERELSIRQAIGASRKRLIQHLLAEAIVLAALGAALAVFVVFSLPALVYWFVGETLSAHFLEALSVDVSMIAFAVGLCLATSLLFGWLPASRFSRPAIMPILKDDAGGGGARVGGFQRVIAALQVALAVPILITSALGLERLRVAATADLGFAAEALYAAPLNLETIADSGGVRVREVFDNLAKVDGVASVTIADGFPLDSRYRSKRVSLTRDANVAPIITAAHVTRVGDGYLHTMGIPLLRGRTFTPGDAEGAEMVTVISKSLADQLLDNTDGIDVIGRQLVFGLPGREDKTPVFTIVGVTADFAGAGMRAARAQMLLPLAQHPHVRRDSVPISDDRQGTPVVMVVARAAAGVPAAKMTAALENAIREVQPAFDAASIDTGARRRQDSMTGFLEQSTAGGLIGGVILLLAALGIYGVVGLMVTTRTREIAVRVTLGASRARVVGMILFDVVKLVAPGVVVGLLISVATFRGEGGVLVDTAEPLAYVVGAAVAFLTAILSSFAPARRAASVEPMVAMRSK